MKSLTIAGGIGNLLRADFETGKLFWLPRDVGLFSDRRSCSTWNAKYSEKEALTYLDPHGYRCGRLFNRQIKAHRAIWALANGEWPEAIDHINGDRSDNRLTNLRCVTTAENNRNMRRRSDNSSGVTGIYWDKPKEMWTAHVCGQHLGRFAKFADAVSARKQAELKFGFHENHGAR